MASDYLAAGSEWKAGIAGGLTGIADMLGKYWESELAGKRRSRDLLEQQEIWEQRTMENKRLEERGKLRDTEQKIERTVYQRGITQSIDFATFKNKHIEALYGGINTPDLKRMRRIPKARTLADFDTDVELKAKSFALGMTDHNIRAQNLVGKDRLQSEVVANSAATREALLARGIIPEKLKPEEDIKKIERRRAKEQKVIDAGLKKLLG